MNHVNDSETEVSRPAVRLCRGTNSFDRISKFSRVPLNLFFFCYDFERENRHKISPEYDGRLDTISISIRMTMSLTSSETEITPIFVGRIGMQFIKSRPIYQLLNLNTINCTRADEGGVRTF